MIQAVSIRNTATDHGGIIYHAPPPGNRAPGCGPSPLGMTGVGLAA
jgi:hypothetical protein